jgi:hypothetical protein
MKYCKRLPCSVRIALHIMQRIGRSKPAVRTCGPVHPVARLLA